MNMRGLDTHLWHPDCPAAGILKAVTAVRRTGRIEVEGEPGKGTTFTGILPAGGGRT